MLMDLSVNTEQCSITHRCTHFACSFELFPAGSYFQYLPVTNNDTMNICIQLFVGTYIFVSLGLIPMSGITGSYDGYMFILKKKLPNYSSKYLFHFTFLPAIYEGSCFSTSSLTLGIVSLLYYSLSNDCVVIAQCIFLIINDAGHN